MLVLGTADWNQPIATNQHYVVRELARAHKVLFVESIGLRRPTLSSSDLTRIARRLKPARALPNIGRLVPPNVTVITPRVIPVHVRATRDVNQRLLHVAVKSWLDSPPPRLLWTYSPVTYGLEAYADLTVYHCVDLLAEVVGIDKALIDRAERNLARQGVKAIGSSRVVVEHLKGIGFNHVEYWPNVADTTAISQERPSAPDRRGRAIFAGRLTADKIDFAIVHAIVEAGLEVTLAGPVGTEADQRAIDRLAAAGVEYLGHLDFRQLAREYWKSAVGLIPYPLNSYTAGVSPLKLYEYLAAGLSVVATPLPEIRRADIGGVTICESVDFPDAVAAAVMTFSESEAEARMDMARRHSWVSRGEAVRAMVHPILRP